VSNEQIDNNFSLSVWAILALIFLLESSMPHHNEHWDDLKPSMNLSGTKEIYFGRQTFLPSGFGIPAIKGSWMRDELDKW